MPLSVPTRRCAEPYLPLQSARSQSRAATLEYVPILCLCSPPLPSRFIYAGEAAQGGDFGAAAAAGDARGPAVAAVGRLRRDEGQDRQLAHLVPPGTRACVFTVSPETTPCLYYVGVPRLTHRPDVSPDGVGARRGVGGAGQAAHRDEGPAPERVGHLPHGHHAGAGGGQQRRRAGGGRGGDRRRHVDAPQRGQSRRQDPPTDQQARVPQGAAGLRASHRRGLQSGRGTRPTKGRRLAGGFPCQDGGNGAHEAGGRGGGGETRGTRV